MENRWILRITVGFLWYSQLREVLTGYSWKDEGFRWKEGPGLLTRTFYVKGHLFDIKELRERFHDFSSEMEPERSHV